MKKRILALCLACLLAASMTACGDSSTAESSKAKSSSVSDSSSVSSSESKADSKSSKEESSTAESKTEATVTTEPAKSSETDSEDEFDDGLEAITVKTDEFEYKKDYYAYSKKEKMFLYVTGYERDSSIIISNVDNSKHYLVGTMQDFTLDSPMAKHYTEIKPNQIMWKYFDLQYNAADDGWKYPANCKPLDYKINGTTVTVTLVEYEVDNENINMVKYIPGSEKAVTFKFISKDDFEELKKSLSN